MMSGVFGALLGGLLLSATIESMITVDDYFVFNVGKVTYEGEDRVMSIGAFGHVFALSREQIRQRIQDK